MKLLIKNNRSLFIVLFITGVLFCTPVMGKNIQSIEGEVISVDYSNQQLTLHVINPITTTITVSYDERTTMCGQGEGSLKGCCVRVGNRAEIKGAFSISDDTLFSAVSIRGAYHKRRHDPTGVRSRLHSCTRGIISGQ